MSATDARKPTLIERVREFIEADRQKLGGMTLGAWMRLGLAELREVFSPGGNVTQQTPYGMFGTLTPGEVAAGRQTDSSRQPEFQAMEGELSRLPTPAQLIDNAHAYQAERNGTEIDRERGAIQGDIGPLPTPSQVIDNPQASLPDGHDGPEQQNVHGREM
jgi:hypothetical protein